ncbi:MAG: hypothetical protein VYE40_05120 [Myxococcota bacterium]|jgi:hypothetical protein|nr:hypothetical protein [Myxococcota bacterium]MEC9440471.1 hypothetical protein [Myxococcota bacterium]
MWRNKTVSIAFIALFTLLAGSAHAETNVQEWKDGPKSKISARDFIPTPSTEEAYTERYTFSVDLDGGGWIGTYLTISNLGVGDNHAAAQVRIQLPERDKEFEYFQRVGKEAWTSSEATLDLRVAAVRLATKGEKGFTIELDDPSSGVKMELEFKNDLARWKPGNGRIDVEDGYLAYGMLAPRASVKGRVFIDGKWRDVKSTRRAFGDHAATNVAPYAFADRFSRFRVFDKDLTIAWREVKLGEKYGGRSVTWVLVGYKNKIVFSDAAATMRTGRVSKDGQTGYNIPYAVQIDGKDGKDQIKLVLRGSRMKRTDLLESYGTFARVVAGAVSKPYRYDFPCEYTIQMNIGGATATVKGKGSYSFDLLN